MTDPKNKRLLGILGYPLGHSYSPAMHNHALQALGLAYEYRAFPVDSAGLRDKLEELKAAGFVGANVTIPHKQAVLELVEPSPISRSMGVVNTIHNRDGKLHGTTTDPVGFLRGFEEAGHSFDGKSVAILGNGGVARTIAFALALEAKPARIAVFARDPFKSRDLSEDLRTCAQARLDVIPLAEFGGHGKDFDVLVNATSVGMSPNVDASPISAEWIRPEHIVYDTIYNPEETRLLRDARERGAKTVGGLGMLVHQGIASFELWTGVKPDPALFYAGIRARQAAAAAPSGTKVSA